jgi:hypothetical protein
MAIGIASAQILVRCVQRVITVPLFARSIGNGNSKDPSFWCVLRLRQRRRVFQPDRLASDDDTIRDETDCAALETKMHRSTLIALVATLALGACAIPAVVDSFTAPEANLPAMKTYAWKPGEFVLPQFPEPGLAATADEQLRNAVEAELAKLGYKRVDDAATADFLVSVHVAGQRRLVVEERPRVGAPSPNQVLSPSGPPLPAASEMPRTQSVRDGTVTVFAHDRAGGALLWRGTVEAEGKVGSNRAMVRKAVQFARDIVRQFPEHQR